MTKEINFDEVTFTNLSAVDDIGNVFFWNGRVLRGVNPGYGDTVKNLLNSEMLSKLINSNMFPKSWISDDKLDGYEFLVEHEKISNVTYPYEWTFSMLKDAALLILELNSVIHEFNFQTKDCHGFNIVFDNCVPKFVDLGSLEKLDTARSGWLAYDEFIRWYYYSLYVWGTGNEFVARRTQLGEEIMPHYSYMQYRYPILRLLKNSYVRKIADNRLIRNKMACISENRIQEKMPKYGEKIFSILHALSLLPSHKRQITKLKHKIHKINKKKSNTIWSNYDDIYFKEREILSTKRFERILELVNMHDLESVTDLGCNRGAFAELLLEKTSIKNVVCIDSDEMAVDGIYNRVKISKKNITPVLSNFVSPFSTYNGDPPCERLKSEAVISLAVTHHLLLSQKLSINRVLGIILSYSSNLAFIEFMPLGMWDGVRGQEIPSWYTVDWFRESLNLHAEILLEEKLEKNRIIFVARHR